MLVRSGPLSHPEVLELLTEHFVPVAIDVAAYKQMWEDIRETASSAGGGLSGAITPFPDESDVQIFRAIDAQSPMSQGIWITTPDGKLLRSFYGIQPHALLATIDAAITDWKNLRPSDPLALPESGGATADAAPAIPGSIRLVFFGRLFDGESRLVFRDFAYAPAEQWNRLLPDELQLGDTFACPETLLQPIASRLYPGEMRLIVRKEELKHVAASLRLREIRDGIAVVDLLGDVSMDGTFPFLTRRRMYEGRLRGELRWSLEPRELVSLQMVSDGKWQSETPGGRPDSGAAGAYPGGVSPEPLAMSPPVPMWFLIEVPSSDQLIHVVRSR